MSIFLVWNKTNLKIVAAEKWLSWEGFTTLADSSRLKVKFYSCKVRLRTVKPGALVSRQFESKLSWKRKGNWYFCCWLTSSSYRNTTNFGNCTLFLQFYAYCIKEVFFPLQVCTIYLVNFYIKELAHDSVLLLCSKHKIVKTKFNFKKSSYFDMLAF